LRDNALHCTRKTPADLAFGEYTSDISGILDAGEAFSFTASFLINNPDRCFQPFLRRRG
jgi:hypothetical protein